LKKLNIAFSHINYEKKIKKSNSDWLVKTTNDQIISYPPLKVSSYDKLVMIIAQLAYYNRNNLLFFRGQHIHYLKNNCTTLLPSIYRVVPPKKIISLKRNFENLQSKTESLKSAFNSRNPKFAGTNLINKYPEIVHSILQHYRVCETPFLDITHSIHVACSFALDNNIGEKGYIFVLGLPPIIESINYNTNEELVNIRLLNICPPQAKRPQFQEGYMLGTFPFYRLNEPSRISQFDCARRLIAVFEIPNDPSFWGNGFNQIPPDKLYPKTDLVGKVCEKLKSQEN
jgi:hypothetical protein